jgi:hypothetical protein
MAQVSHIDSVQRSSAVSLTCGLLSPSIRYRSTRTMAHLTLVDYGNHGIGDFSGLLATKAAADISEHCCVLASSVESGRVHAPSDARCADLSTSSTPPSEILSPRRCSSWLCPWWRSLCEMTKVLVDRSGRKRGASLSGYECNTRNLTVSRSTAAPSITLSSLPNILLLRNSHSHLHIHEWLARARLAAGSVAVQENYIRDFSVQRAKVGVTAPVGGPKGRNSLVSRRDPFSLSFSRSMKSMLSTSA